MPSVFTIDGPCPRPIGVGKHREIAKRLEKEARVHVAKSKKASLDFDCREGLREARRAVKAAAKADVHARDSKERRTISRIQKLETETGKLVDAVGRRCFAKLPKALRPRRRR